MSTPTLPLIPDLESDIADRHLDAALLDRYLKFEKEQEGWGHPDTRQQGPLNYLIDQVASNKRSLSEAGSLVDLWLDKAWKFDQYLDPKGDRNFNTPAAANILRHTKEGKVKAEAIAKKRKANQDLRQANQYRDRVLHRYAAAGGGTGPLLMLALSCVKEKGDPYEAAKKLDAWANGISRSTYPPVDSAMVTPEVQEMAMEILGRSSFGTAARKEVNMADPPEKGAWNPKGMTKLKVDRGEENPNNAVAGLSRDAVFLEGLYRQREQETGRYGPLHKLAADIRCDPKLLDHHKETLSAWMSTKFIPASWGQSAEGSDLESRAKLLVESEWGKQALKDRDESEKRLRNTLLYTTPAYDANLAKLTDEDRVIRFAKYLERGPGERFLRNLASHVDAGVISLGQAARVVDEWAVSAGLPSDLPKVHQTGPFTLLTVTEIRKATALDRAFKHTLEIKISHPGDREWTGLPRADLLKFLWSNDSFMELPKLSREAEGFLAHLAEVLIRDRASKAVLPMTRVVGVLTTWLCGNFVGLTGTKPTREGLVRETMKEILQNCSYDQVARAAFSGMGRPNTIYHSEAFEKDPDSQVQQLKSQTAIGWFSSHEKENTPLEHLAQLVSLNLLSVDEAHEKIFQWFKGEAITLQAVGAHVLGSTVLQAMKRIVGSLSMPLVIQEMEARVEANKKARDIIRAQVLSADSPLGTLALLVESKEISVKDAQDKFARWVKGETVEFRGIPKGKPNLQLMADISWGLNLEDLITERMTIIEAQTKQVSYPTGGSAMVNSGTLQVSTAVDDLTQKVDEMAKKVQSMETKMDEAMKMAVKAASSEKQGSAEASSPKTINELLNDLDDRSDQKTASKTATKMALKTASKVGDSSDEESIVNKLSDKEFPEWLEAIKGVPSNMRPRVREQLADLAASIPVTSQLKKKVDGLLSQLDKDITEDNRKGAKRIGFSDMTGSMASGKTGLDSTKLTRDQWITKLVDQTTADLVQFDSQVGRTLTLWDLKVKIRQVLPHLHNLQEGTEISFDIYRRFLRWAIGYQESMEIIAALTTALNQMGVLPTDTIRQVGSGTGISDTLIGTWMKTFEPTEPADTVVKVATDKGILTGSMEAILANLPDGVEVVRIDRDPSKLAEVYHGKSSHEFLRIMTDAVMTKVLTTEEAAKAVDEHKQRQVQLTKERAKVRRKIMMLSDTYTSKEDDESVEYATRGDGDDADEGGGEDQLMDLLLEEEEEASAQAVPKHRAKKASISKAKEGLSPNEIALMEDVNEFLSAKTTQVMSKWNHYSKDVGTIVKGLGDDVIRNAGKDLVSEIEQMRISLKNPGFYKNPKDPVFDNIGYMSDNEIIFGKVYRYLRGQLDESGALPEGGVLVSDSAAYKDVLTRENNLLKAIMAGEQVQNTSMSRKARLAAVSFGNASKEDLNHWLAEEVLKGGMTKEMAAEIAVQHTFLAPSFNDVHADIQRSVKEKLAAMTPARGNKRDEDSESNGTLGKDEGKRSMKDIALGTVKSDMKEIALRTGVKRTRAILAGRIAEFWAKRSTPQKIGESDADYQARLKSQTEGIGAFLVSDAGQNVLSYAIGFSWPLLEDRIPDPKVREYGAMVAREMRIQGGTELLDGFLVEVAMPLLGVLTEEAKNFGQMAMGIGMPQEHVRVDPAATAKDLAQDQEMAALKARLKQLEESRDHTTTGASTEAQTATNGR